MVKSGWGSLMEHSPDTASRVSKRKSLSLRLPVSIGDLWKEKAHCQNEVVRGRLEGSLQPTGAGKTKTTRAVTGVRSPRKGEGNHGKEAVQTRARPIPIREVDR